MRLDDFLGGTLAPFSRALESPMAMACLRFLTLCFPERMWCISVRTSSPAFLPYLRPPDFFFELADLERVEADLARPLELDFLCDADLREPDFVAIKSSLAT